MPIDWNKRVRAALTERCVIGLWGWCHLPNIGVGFQRDGFHIAMDKVGIWLYRRIAGRWERCHGLAYSNMRSIIGTGTITFMCGSTLTFISEQDFVYAPKEHVA